MSKGLLSELESLMTGHWISDLPNFCALFYHRLPDISWIGFYLNDGKGLKLGPFHGKIACTDIAYERGVCGAAFSMQQTLIVKDVHEFPDHIACDAESNSEIVIPITVNGKKLGVLDIDSKVYGRFTESDKVFFEEALTILMKKIGKDNACFCYEFLVEEDCKKSPGADGQSFSGASLIAQ